MDINSASAFTKNYKFNSCLLKTTAFSGTTSINNVFNQSANFINASSYDFKIGNSSAARNIGDAGLTTIYPYIFVQTDILGAVRSGSIDAGAYQYP